MGTIEGMSQPPTVAAPREPVTPAAVTLGLGVVRLVKRRSAWWVPAVGIALIGVNFSVVARLLSP